MMSLSSLQRLKARGLAQAYALSPSVLTIAGETYPAALKLQQIALATEEAGLVEHRGLVAWVLKSDHPTEPVIGSVIAHDELEYVLHTFTGREDSEIHWRIVAVERDRTR